MSLIENDNKRLRERLSQLTTSQQKAMTSSEHATQQPVTSSTTHTTRQMMPSSEHATQQPVTSSTRSTHQTMTSSHQSDNKFETGKRTIPGNDMLTMCC